MRTDYFPGNEADYPGWYANLSVKFAGYAPTLGLQSEVVGLQNDAAMVTYLINDYKGQFDAGRTLATGFANGMLRGGIADPTAIAPYPQTPVFAGTMVEADIIDRTRALVKRIKAASGYTEMMGADMRIVASGEDEELTAPTLAVTPLDGRRLRIKWHKGSATGLEVFVDFGNDYPKQGRVITEPDQIIVIEGVPGSGPVSTKVKGIYQKKGVEVGALGPTYATLLLP